MYTRLSLIVSSMLSFCYYYLEAKGKVAIFFFGKSYHDSINNENNSHLIIVVDIHSMLRNINCGIRLDRKSVV